MGAKKAQKLGAKKVGAGELIDFDEAEKKAKEEAERIAKLGYDPEAEDEEKKKEAKKNVATPTPSSPVAARGHQRNSSDTERLGLQMNRLGFGMVGAGAAAAAAAPVAKKMGGFGSTGGASKDGTSYGFQHGVDADMKQMRMRALHARSSANRRASHPMNSLAVKTLTRRRRARHAPVCRTLTVLLLSPVARTLAGKKRKPRLTCLTMVISRTPPASLHESLPGPLARISTI